MRFNHLFVTIFVLMSVASCTNDDNEMPMINIENITIKGNGTSTDNLYTGDTLTIDINLQSGKKDLSSFSCKYNGIEDFELSIISIDDNTTVYEGNDIATSPNQDCTITFRDGTFSTDITIQTVLWSATEQSPQLNLYLFSEKETAHKDIDLHVVGLPPLK